MNQAKRQRNGISDLRSLARSPVARLSILAAALLPLALVRAASAPGAAGTSYATPAPITRDLGTLWVPSELLHDLPLTAKHSDSAPALPTNAVLAGFKLAGHNPRVVRMKVTAYCPCSKCCGPHAHGLTASGCSVTYNSGLFVAADTTLFPLGTHVSIPGYANATPVEVIDRGSAIKGNHLDVFFPTHEQAKTWGCKWLTVIVSD